MMKKATKPTKDEGFRRSRVRILLVEVAVWKIYQVIRQI